MNVVAKGGTVRTTWSLYQAPEPGRDPTVLANPDGFPTTPRFEIRDETDTVVDGYDDLTYTVQKATGVFVLNLPIPLGDQLPSDATYTVVCKQDTAELNNVPMVGRTGASPLTTQFKVLDNPKEAIYSAFRPYADADELHNVFGLDPKPADSEVLFAQQLIDDFMHRSLWPMVIEKERKYLPPDRNAFTLLYRPVIRLFAASAQDPIELSSALGRYGYGRRDRRVLNQTSGNYLSVMAVMGSPPRFIPIDPAQIEFHPNTGQVWIPTGFFLVNYSEVEMTYEAGYRVIPFAAKVALAETIAWVRVKGFGQLSSWSVGRVSHQTGQSLITDEVKTRLRPFQVKVLA